MFCCCVSTAVVYDVLRGSDRLLLLVVVNDWIGDGVRRRRGGNKPTAKIDILGFLCLCAWSRVRQFHARGSGAFRLVRTSFIWCYVGLTSFLFRVFVRSFITLALCSKKHSIGSMVTTVLDAHTSRVCPSNYCVLLGIDSFSDLPSTALTGRPMKRRRALGAKKDSTQRLSRRVEV